MKAPVKFERFAPGDGERQVLRRPATRARLHLPDGRGLGGVGLRRRTRARCGADGTKRGLPLFDFAALAEMEKQKPSAVIPAALLDMDGKAGDGRFCAGPAGDPRAAPRVEPGLVGRQGPGQAATVYTAATVFLRDAGTSLPRGSRAGCSSARCESPATPRHGPTKGSSACTTPWGGERVGHRASRCGCGAVSPLPAEAAILAAFFSSPFDPSGGEQDLTTRGNVGKE